MTTEGCRHGPAYLTGGPDSCPDCLKEQDAALEQQKQVDTKFRQKLSQVNKVDEELARLRQVEAKAKELARKWLARSSTVKWDANIFSYRHAKNPGQAASRVLKDCTRELLQLVEGDNG